MAEIWSQWSGSKPITNAPFEPSFFKNQMFFSKSWLSLMTLSSIIRLYSLWYLDFLIIHPTFYHASECTHNYRYNYDTCHIPNLLDFHFQILSHFFFLVTDLTITWCINVNDYYYYFFGCINITEDEICSEIWQVSTFWSAKESPKDECCSTASTASTAYCDVSSNSSSKFSRLSLIFPRAPITTDKTITLTFHSLCTYNPKSSFFVIFSNSFALML